MILKAFKQKESSAASMDKALTQAFESALTDKSALRVNLFNAIYHGGSLRIQLKPLDIVSRLFGATQQAVTLKDIVKNAGFIKMQKYLKEKSICIEDVLISTDKQGVPLYFQIKVKSEQAAAN